MKLAIMQPYFLPYIGYFQLMASVDKFIIFDDVNYIQRGWINRNRLLLNGEAHYFTIPLSKSSQNLRVCDICVTTGMWREKLLKKIKQTYAKAAYFQSTFVLCERIVGFESEALDEYLLHSLTQVAHYIGIKTEIIASSRIYNNAELKGQDRILDICKKENANTYINAAGGMNLYNNKMFFQSDVRLCFLHAKDVEYKQFGEYHIPWLSIIDVLMFNSRSAVGDLLGRRDIFYPLDDAPE